MFADAHDEFGLDWLRFPRLGGRFAAYFAAEDDDGSSGGSGGTEPSAADGSASSASDDGDDQGALAEERARLIAEAKKYRKRAQAAEARLRELEGRVLSDEELEEYRRLKEAQAKAEEEAKKAEGRYDELLRAKEEQFQKQLDEIRQRTETYRQAFERVAVTDRLKSILAARGVKHVDQAAFVLQGQFRWRAVAELVDGKAVVKVVDQQGKPVIDAECEGPDETISVEKLVDAFLADPAGQVYLPPSGDTGSGATKGGEGPERVDIAELEANPEKRYAFIREHGVDEYMKLLGEWKRRRRVERGE